MRDGCESREGKALTGMRSETICHMLLSKKIDTSGLFLGFCFSFFLISSTLIFVPFIYNLIITKVVSLASTLSWAPGLNIQISRQLTYSRTLLPHLFSSLSCITSPPSLLEETLPWWHMSLRLLHYFSAPLYIENPLTFFLLHLNLLWYLKTFFYKFISYWLC